MKTHPIHWTRDEVAIWFFFFAHQTGVPASTNPTGFQRVRDADVDGKLFITMTPDHMVSLGFTLGASQSFHTKRGEWLESYGWPPSDTMDPTSGAVHVGDHSEVSVTFVLEKLLSLDEAAFEFELEMMVIITWEDPKIFTRCKDAGVGGFERDDPCQFFWQPSFVWPNVKLDPHPSATISPSIIEDFGFNTVLGATDANGTPNQGASAVLNTSIGSRMYRVRGTFYGSFFFADFPYDSQQLNVSLQMPFDLPRTKARFVTRANPQPAAYAGGADLPLWKVACVTTHDSWMNPNQAGETWLAASDDAYAAWYRRVTMLSPSEMFTEFHGDGGSAASMSEEAMQWSTTTVSVHVTRLNTFYCEHEPVTWAVATAAVPHSSPTPLTRPTHRWLRVPPDWNFVVVVMLLTITSFFSLLLDQSALDARLGLTLTVILGLNVFQIVVIDNMPATGYLTRMHEYTLLCCCLVVGVAVENVIVQQASKRYVRILLVLERINALRKQPGAKQAAQTLQARARLWIKRRRAGTSPPPSSAKVRPAASATVDPKVETGGADTRATPQKVAAGSVHETWPTRRRLANSLLPRPRQLRRRISSWLDSGAAFCHSYLDLISLVVFPLAFALTYMRLSATTSAASLGLPAACQSR
jgi:hypothetical protein